MSRRANRANPDPAPVRSSIPAAPDHPRTRTPPLPTPEAAAEEIFFPQFAERCRRFALGGLACLLVTRAFYPSEEADTGSGLVWIFLVLGLTGLTVATNLLAGATRLRWSPVDGIVYLLMALVAASAGVALDRRPAIIMAWEWGGLALLYFLTRNLPRTRAESSAVALVLTATAGSVATYGLFQGVYELPRLRAAYLADPVAMLSQMRIDPNSSYAESFRQRLLFSLEPFATFGLPNSLAGFLVAPLAFLVAVALENMADPERRGRWGSLALAAVPALVIGVCLLLTKSRSAYVGLAVAVLMLAWHYRSLVPRRVLLGTGLTLGLVLTGLIAAGVATRQLDVQILSEARKSLGYRWEYWVGTWGIITDAPPPYPVRTAPAGIIGGGEDAAVPRPTGAFWHGVGPANFAGPYLRHKLPGASEEIRDPHNLLLEVWAEAGLPAAILLVAAIGSGLWAIGRRPPASADSVAERSAAAADPPLVREHLGIVVLGGLGWFGVVLLGQLDPINDEGALRRWVILGSAWLGTLVLLAPLWGRRSIPAVAPGAAVLALATSLLAAGGIGIPAVAMILWVSLALGLNLRDDRPAGRTREVGGLGLGVTLACLWAALAGTYFGAIAPIWRSDAALAQGSRLMQSPAPNYEAARAAYLQAIADDRHATEPYVALADLEYRFWKSPEAGKRHQDNWTKVFLAFDKALEPQYRNPDNLGIRRRQSLYARMILNDLGQQSREVPPIEILGLRKNLVAAARQAVLLYPASADLRGDLAQASADLGLYPDAAAEARAALDLDDRMPHRDKKLRPERRANLTEQLPRWEELAKQPPPTAADLQKAGK